MILKFRHFGAGLGAGAVFGAVFGALIGAGAQPIAKKSRFSPYFYVLPERVSFLHSLTVKLIAQK